MAAWLLLLAGTNAAAVDDVPKKRSALEKRCIVFNKAQFVSRWGRAELELLKSDVMVTLQIMKKATENII